jgi:hypothetical protein
MKNTPTLFEELSGMMASGISSNYSSVVKKSMIYFEDKRQKGFNEFTRNLLKGKATKDNIEYEKMFDITEDQYYALLNASIEDEEKEKSYVYANVYRNILNEQIPKSDYPRFIRLVKNLPYSAIELLPSLYIYKNFNTKNKSLKKYFDEIYKEYKYEIKFLDQNNIIELPNGMVFGDSILKINDKLFSKVIETFFKEEDLRPEKYNIELWKENNVLVLSDNPLIQKAPVAYVIQLLRQRSIRNEHLDYQSSINPNQYSHIICIVNDTNLSKINELNFEEIKGNTEVIRVTGSKTISRGTILNLTHEEDKKKLKSTFSK